MVRTWALVVAIVAASCTRSGPETPGADGEASRRGALPRNDRAAVRKAVKRATGEDFGERICATWSDTFALVVAVGSFADDAGCMYEGTFVDGKWRARGDDRIVPDGLNSAGWRDADSAARQKLARAWVQEVAQAFGGSFVHESSTAFTFDDTPSFSPPAVSAADDGGVVVSGWVREPAGMVWEERFHFTEYRFAPDGTLSVTTRDSFSVKGQRIQAAEAATEPSD